MSATQTLATTDLTFTSSASALPASRAARRTGLTLRGVAIAFLVFDASLKLFQSQAVIDGTAQLGYPAGSLFFIGLLEAALLLVYLLPRTSILGAVLWTGYLGGAVATHVRVSNPMFTHVLFPIYVAVCLWLGLWLTDARLRRVFASPQTA